MDNSKERSKLPATLPALAVPELVNRWSLVGDPMIGASGPDPPEAPGPAGKWEPTRRSGEFTVGHGDPALLNGGGDPPQLLPDVDRRRLVIPGGVPTQNWIY